MSAVDTTIVILALLKINQGLHSTFLDTIWVILIYLLVLAALTTQMGRLGDIFGRGRIFNAGFLVFIVGSAMSGAAPNISFLIGSRAVQGFGAVMLQSNSSAIVADHFPPEERGKAFGITSMGWNIGGTLGIVLGGLITTLIGWRYIFYINVPIGLIGFVIALKYIRDNKRTSVKIDYAGTGLLLAALALIAYGATNVAGYGLDTFNLALVVTGILVFVPFVLVEKYAKSPMLALRAFKVRLLSFSLLAAFLQAVGYLSVVFILIMYLQGVRGFSPLYAALILVPGYVLASLLAPLMGRLSDRIGAGFIATTGIFFMAIGIMVYFFLTVTSTIYLVILGSLISGFGGAMFWPSNNSAVMSGAPRDLYGSISGLLRTLSNMGTLLSYVITVSVASLAVSRAVAFEVFLGVHAKVPASFINGIHSALIVSIILLIAAGFLSAGRIRKRTGSGEPSTSVSSSNMQSPK